MTKRNIAILYICTGNYLVFWKNFYESAEALLLPEVEKHYFVFTDATEIFMQESARVHRVYQQALRWPLPTLYRFRFFKSIAAQLEAFDYVYFFNANCRVDSLISSADFLPGDDEALVVTQHPGFWDKPREAFTYETNSASAAYIAPAEGTRYVAGGLNGGRAMQYLEYINQCDAWTNADLAKGITALWHDESYLNRYIIGKKVKVLDPGYLYAAGWSLPFTKKIHLEDKKQFLKGYGKYSIGHKLRKLLGFSK